MGLVQEMTLFLIMVNGLLGNGLVIRVVSGDVLMQTVGNKFVFSMAVSDLGLCMFFMPFSLISLFRHEWVFGLSMCHVTAFCGDFFTRVSTITLSVVVLEKHSNIVQRKLKRFGRNGVLMTFFVLWVSALVFSLPYPPRQAVYDDYLGNCIMLTSIQARFELVLIFVLLEGLLFKLVPVILMVMLLGKVFKKMHKRRCVAYSRNKHNLMNMDHLRIMAEDYTVCTTSLVVACHVLLCLPYMIIHLIRICSYLTIPQPWRLVAFWLVLFSSSLRPLIYGLRNRRSRNLILRYYRRVKRNLIAHNFYMKLGRGRRAYVVPGATQQQIEQTKVDEFQIVNVIDIRTAPLFTRRRMTVRTINTTTEQTFLDLNCVPEESHEVDCYEMMSLTRKESRQYDLRIQDIETEDI